jgi:penicillin V acylase-like amidase (Ntn superfamily)
LAFVLIVTGVMLFRYRSEVSTLSTLKQVNSYPFYTMTYDGDYGFDDFLKQGAHSDRDIEKFVTSRLLKGIPIQFNVTGAGCSAFAAKNGQGEALYGRNFDFKYTPSLLVKTKPENGYASVSMVNLSFAGYTKENLPKPQQTSSFLTLAAPYLPFDGMNEKGVAMALLAVPAVQTPQDKDKVTLNTTAMIRLVLDKAANVDEAVALMEKYNIYFSGDVKCHYLIEDASGKSVVVEYWNNKLQTVKTNESYQVSTNFIQYGGINLGEGYTEFKRYDIIHNSLSKTNGVLNEKEAMAVLKSAGQESTQWSAVYNLKELKGEVCIAGDYSHPYSFSLK